MRVRLDAAAAREETTRTYVERLETLVDEARLPSGDDLISEIERFLREGGTAGHAPLGLRRRNGRTPPARRNDGAGWTPPVTSA